MVIDDNTDDETLWRPVADWCTTHGVTFFHLADWPGYKSGALNVALREYTDPRAELVGVVDSDYQLDPDFLRRCAPLFADEGVGFIQAPQDYRDWEQAPYFRRLYYSYKYFFAISQPSRNEHDGAIFAGTMGLIRRAALESVGGWDEWCITEDAELSLRLLRAGWSGLHVDDSYGRGVMPLTFEALKSQRYRWCFGGIQILRMHWRSMLPGARTAANRLRPAQRWAYFTGAVQWYGDLLGLAFFLLLLVGAVNLASGGGELFRKLTAFVVATVPVLVALGAPSRCCVGAPAPPGGTRSARSWSGSRPRWSSRASVQGLFAKRAEFLRTPKTTDRTSWWTAIRANWAETGVAVLGLAGIAAGLSRVDTPTPGRCWPACCCSPPSGSPRRRRTASHRPARPRRPCGADGDRPAQQRTGPGDDHAVTRARSRAGTDHGWPGDQVVVPPRAAIAPSSTAASSSVIGADSRRRGINQSATDENAQQPMM